MFVRTGVHPASLTPGISATAMSGAPADPDAAEEAEGEGEEPGAEESEEEAGRAGARPLKQSRPTVETHTNSKRKRKARTKQDEHTNG